MCLTLPSQVSNELFIKKFTDVSQTLKTMFFKIKRPNLIDYSPSNL